MRNQSGIKQRDQRLLFNFRELEDDHTLNHYNIQKNSELNLIMRIKGSGKRARAFVEGGGKEEVMGLCKAKIAMKMQVMMQQPELTQQLQQKINILMENDEPTPIQDFIKTMNLKGITGLHNAILNKKNIPDIAEVLSIHILPERAMMEPATMALTSAKECSKLALEFAIVKEFMDEDLGCCSTDVLWKLIKTRCSNHVQPPPETFPCFLEMFWLNVSAHVWNELVQCFRGAPECVFSHSKCFRKYISAQAWKPLHLMFPCSLEMFLQNVSKHFWKRFRTSLEIQVRHRPQGADECHGDLLLSYHTLMHFLYLLVFTLFCGASCW
jgi:hypothetical protein